MIELGPRNSPPTDGDPTASTADERFLVRDHPFLRHGRWQSFAELEGGELTARIIASVDPRQQTAAGPVGCLGFATLTAGRSGEGPVTPAARHVLAAAMDWLVVQGAAVVRAPVQLSTWYGHRAVTAGFPDEGGIPPFPLEPRPDRALPALLAAAGFTPAHQAVSCLVDCREVVAQAGRALERARLSGLRDREIRLDDLGAELSLLHRLSAGIFRGTWGLSDIDDDEFVAIYRPFARFVDPGLIRILEEPVGQAVGFALGLGWFAGLDPGSAVEPTFILKTIGVTSEARVRHPGIGVALIAMIHLAALERGYATAIHALMARESIAHRLSLRWGREIRGYATFERALP